MIQVNDLTRYYGDFSAVQGISFSVEKGEIIGILGLNGAGKSTILKILAGLLLPSSGSVVVDGTDMVSNPEEMRQHIGFLPEDPPLYVDMTVHGFLRHIGKLKGMTSSQLITRLPKVLALTDLVDREHQVIQTLSHGYRKRVGIAQAIIHDPKLVILDEPISGLDPAQIVEMRDVIRGLGEDRAVMISSHILKEISMTCDRVIVIHRGRMASMVDLQAEEVGPERIMLTVRADATAFQKWATENARVTQYSETLVAGHFVTAVIDLTGDVREDFLADVAKAGFGIRLVEPPNAPLESLFLGVIQEEVAA